MVSAIDFAVRDVAGGSQRGTVAGEGQGNFIQVASGDSVSLNVSRASVVGYEQQGGDLIVALSDGRKIVLSGYFDEAAGDVNHLYLSDNGTITEVVLSETGDGMLFADYGPVQGWEKWSPLDDLRFAEADGVSGGIIAADEPAGMAALVPGLLGGAGGVGAAAAVVGGAAVLGGGGGGGGGTSGGGGDGNDTTGGGDGDGNDTTGGGDDGADDRAPPTVDAQQADPLTTNTSNPHIAVTGTGEPGDTVKVTVGGEVKTTTIGTDGTWAVTYPSNGLPSDGTHTAQVVVTEHGSTITHTLTGPKFIIDMTPPDVETTSGTTLQGDVENLAEYANGVSLGGTGEAGASISVVINGQTQTTTVGASGQWTVTFTQSQIAGGDYHTLPAVITATDPLGNKTVINRTIVIDTVTSVDVDAGQIGGDDRMTMAETGGFNLTGTAEAGASVKVVFEGQTVTVTANASGAWSAPFGFGSFGKMTRDGLVNVTATDAAGNTSTTTHTIHIDTEVQNFKLTAVDDLSSLSAGADAVNASEALNGVTVSGTVEAGSTVTVKWGDLTLPANAVTVAANGTWTATIPASAIPAGEAFVTVTATARDQYGNTSGTLTQVVEIDRVVTPLTRGGGQIGGDGYINAEEASAGVTLTGTVEANSTVWVKINGGAAIQTTATADGTWAITVPKAGLPVGDDVAMTVQVSARDWVGNIRDLPMETVHIDTVAPTDPVRVGDAGAGNQLYGVATALSADDYTYHAVGATGTAHEITPAAEYNGTVDVGGQPVNAHWAMFGSAIPDGTYLVINNHDAAGNESSTLYLRNTTGEVTVNLAREGLQEFDFGTIDLSAADANLTISANQVLALTGADKQMTIVGGADDVVTLQGATLATSGAPAGFKLYNLGSGASVLIEDDITINATGV